jgi:hypothetical protein
VEVRRVCDGEYFVAEHRSSLDTFRRALSPFVRGAGRRLAVSDTADRARP